MATYDLATILGQLAIVRIWDNGPKVSPATRRFMEIYKPGGIIVYRNNVTSREQIQSLLADFQAINDELGLPGPLIVCADQRGGNHAIVLPETGGLEFPAPIAQSAIADRPAITELARLVGRDMAALGINLNLHPYADYWDNPDAPQFGNAMMGADPQVNAESSVAWIEGLRAAGVGSTYCTFPGGYGTLPYDPHLTPGRLDMDRAEFDDKMLRAPRAAIRAGVDSVMLAHTMFPTIDPTGLPATYSPFLIGEVLRNELGYTGHIMTDAIEMRGVTSFVDQGEAGARAILAGADSVLCCVDDTTHWAVLHKLQFDLEHRLVSEERIHEAFERVRTLKDALKNAGPTGAPLPAGDQAQMNTLIERSLTWVQQPRTVLKAGEPVLAFARWEGFGSAAATIGGADVLPLVAGPTSGRYFAQANGTLGAAFTGAGVTYASVPQSQLELQTCMELSVNRKVLIGSNSIHDLLLARDLQRAGREVYVIHADRPYQVRNFLDLPALLLSYSMQPEATRLAIAAMYGQVQPGGTLPVPLKSHQLSGV